MIQIKFLNEELLISYLKFKNNIKINRNNETVIFDSKEYSITDFLNYLEENEIITYYNNYQTIYSVEERIHKTKPILEFLTFNQTYFDSILSNSFYGKYGRYLIGINETADLLDVTRQTINNMIKDNKLQTYKVGTSVKLKYKDVMDFIEANKAKQ